MNLEECEILGMKAVFALVLLQTQQLDERLNKLRVHESSEQTHSSHGKDVMNM